MNEWKKVKIGDIFLIEKGTLQSSKNISGNYNFIIASSYWKTHNSCDHDCEAVCVPLVSLSGHRKKSIKNIYYQIGKFALGNILCAIIPKDLNQIGVRYLHTYLLMNKNTVLVPLMKGMANVLLSIEDISEINIPLLPFNSNPRIVSITETKLKKIEELEQEIKQRESYINSLNQSVMREVFKNE